MPPKPLREISDSTLPSGPTERAADGSSVFGSPLPAPRRKGCGCWTLSLATLAGATLFVLGFYAIWRWSNARGVERMITTAREKGEPTTWEELSASYPTSPEIERTTALWIRAIEATDPPDLTEADEYDVLMFGRSRPDDEEPWVARERYQKKRIVSPRMLAASQNYLAKVGDAVELAHEARRSGTIARFPIPGDPGFSDEEDVAWRIRDVASFVALDLEVQRLKEPKPPLGDHHLTLVAIGESPRNDPRGMMQMLRTAPLGVANYHLLRSLEAEELTDEELLELQQAWSEVDSASSVRLALQAAQIEAFYELETLVKPDVGVRLCPEEDVYLAGTAFRALLDGADSFATAKQAGRELLPRLENSFDAPLGETRFAGTVEALTDAVAVISALQDSQSRTDALVAVLACERFRRARGDWPVSLDDLVPAWLDEVPTDTYAEKPMIYRRADTGVRVYAVGSDGNDDGGAVEWTDDPRDSGAKVELGKNVLRVANEN